MQKFVSRIFSSYTQRPSGVKEWQIPMPLSAPKPFLSGARLEPEEAQETSYLAASARMASFSMVSMAVWH
jgi:hypothetical protein